MPDLGIELLRVRAAALEATGVPYVVAVERAVETLPGYLLPSMREVDALLASYATPVKES